jgi:hypothetical protein
MRVWGAGLSLMNAASTTFGPALPVPATSCVDGSFALNDAKLAAEAAASLKQHVRMWVGGCVYRRTARIPACAGQAPGIGVVA